MGEFDSKHIYLYTRNNKNIYWRYIDDPFFIWKGTEEENLSFIEILSKNPPLSN